MALGTISYEIKLEGYENFCDSLTLIQLRLLLLRYRTNSIGYGEFRKELSEITGLFEKDI